MVVALYFSHDDSSKQPPSSCAWSLLEPSLARLRWRTTGPLPFGSGASSPLFWKGWTGWGGPVDAWSGGATCEWLLHVITVYWLILVS